RSSKLLRRRHDVAVVEQVLRRDAPMRGHIDIKLMMAGEKTMLHIVEAVLIHGVEQDALGAAGGGEGLLLDPVLGKAAGESDKARRHFENEHAFGGEKNANLVARQKP